MSETIPQEQTHLQTDDQNTNFVKAEKSDPVHVYEKNPAQEEKLGSENTEKQHQQPQQNEQIPDQSGTSLTEKINVEANQQHEKLPENQNPEPSQTIEHNPTIQEQQFENQTTDLQKLESQSQETSEKQPDQSHTPKNENLHKNDEQHDEAESEQIHNEQEKPSDENQIQPTQNENDSQKKIEESPTQENGNLNDSNHDREEEQELKSHPPPAISEEKPEKELDEQISSIFNFFSVTKENMTTTSQNAITKLGELISKSNIVSFIQGNEYRPIITSDFQSEKNETAPSSRRRKSQQGNQIKPRNESLANPIQTVKSPKKPNFSTKTVDSETPLAGGDKSLPKIKVKQPEAKNRNEIEEQIRQHKIQEIVKQKKALEMKLSALQDQLTDLQKVEYSNSPNRAKSKPKETKEEFLDRKKKAVEFAKKMVHEQKAIEVRADQRREARQVLVNREIAALQQLADKKYERKKVLDYIRGQSEAQKKEILKAKYGIPSLEEKKLELKNKREFDKESLDPDFTSQDDQQSKLNTKSSKKLYKSPLLPQVLANDAEQKKVESEKITKRKALHDKQVEYGRGVKDVFLPKVQSKFEARKLKMGVYKSQQVDTYLLRAGKDGLYGYLDKMKNELEVNSVKPQKRPQKHKYEPFQDHHDDDYDRPPTELEHDEDPNVNVAYGKQLVYELQDNWNLADGTASNKIMQNNNNHISPRNPPISSKTPKKHNKKDKDPFSDHYNTQENTYRSSKRVDDDDDDEQEL